MSPSIPDEQAALLAAVVAEPDADAPRLVYADWLQEHADEEQAQYIRDAIRLAGMKGDERKRRALNDRLWKLDRRLWRQWLKPLGIEGAFPYFARGLAELIFYEEVDDFFREVRALFRFLPVRSLGIGIGDGTGMTTRTFGGWRGRRSWPACVRSTCTCT